MARPHQGGGGSTNWLADSGKDDLGARLAALRWTFPWNSRWLPFCICTVL